MARIGPDGDTDQSEDTDGSDSERKRTGTERLIDMIGEGEGEQPTDETTTQTEPEPETETQTQTDQFESDTEVARSQFGRDATGDPTTGPPNQGGGPPDNTTQTEPTDQQRTTQDQPEQTETQPEGEPTSATDPSEGVPGGSETIQSGQPRDSASDPAQRPTEEELEGVNLNELSPERARELTGTEGGQTQFDGPFATSQGLDEQRQATGSPVRPTDPQFAAEASLSQLAAAASNPTVDVGPTGTQRLAQQSPLELRALGLSGGEIREFSPAVDTSDDLRREETFREDFTTQEAEDYLEARRAEMQRLRNRPGPVERQATAEQQAELGEFQREAAEAYDEQLPDVDVGPGDIQLERTGDGISPTLRPGIQRDVQVQQLTEAREQVATQITDSTPFDVEADEVDFGPTGQPRLEESAQQRVEQQQKASVAADVRAGALDRAADDPLDFGSLSAALTQGTVTAANIERTDSGFALDTDVQREIAAAELGVSADNIIVDDGQARVSETFQREQAREGFTEAFEDRREARQVRQNERARENITAYKEALGQRNAAIDAQVENLEDALESALPQETYLASRGTQSAPEVVGSGGGDIELDRDDVEVTDGRLTLTEGAQQRFEQTQFEAARDVFQSRLPTDVSEEDITRDDGQIVLSEQGQEELAEFQREQATEALLTDLKEETGADLDRGDINVEATTNEQGETTFEATLTKSGQQELAGEQTPGSDLPVIGGALEAGGEKGAALEQDLLDIGDAAEDRVTSVDVPDLTLPVPSEVQDKAPSLDVPVRAPTEEEVTGAAAVGVATPEPITTTTGTLVIGGVGAAGASVKAAEKVGVGQGPPTASVAQTVTQTGGEIPVQDSDVRGTTEITIPGTGEFFPSEQQPTTDDVTRATRLGLGEGTAETQVGIGEGTTTTQVGLPGQFDGDTQRAQQDSTVVPDEFPLAGRDFPADPTQERIGDGTPTLDITTSVVGTDVGESSLPDPTQPVTPGDTVGPTIDQTEIEEPEIDRARRFPTGEESVIGRDTAEEAEQRLEDAQQREVTETENQLSRQQGQTRPGDMGEGAASGVGAGAGVESGTQATPTAEATGLSEAIGAGAEEATTEALATPEAVEFENPTLEENVTLPEYAYPNVAVNTPRINRRLRLPLPDLDTDTKRRPGGELDMAADMFDNVVLGPSKAARFEPFGGD